MKKKFFSRLLASLTASVCALGSMAAAGTAYAVPEPNVGTSSTAITFLTEDEIQPAVTTAYTTTTMQTTMPPICGDYGLQIECDTSPMTVGETRKAKIIGSSAVPLKNVRLYSNPKECVDFDYEEGSDTFTITAKKAVDQVYIEVAAYGYQFRGSKYLKITDMPEPAVTTSAAVSMPETLTTMPTPTTMPPICIDYGMQIECDASPMTVGETREAKIIGSSAVPLKNVRFYSDPTDCVDFDYEEGSDFFTITAKKAADQVYIGVSAHGYQFGGSKDLKIIDPDEPVVITSPAVTKVSIPASSTTMTTKTVATTAANAETTGVLSGKVGMPITFPVRVDSETTTIKVTLTDDTIAELIEGDLYKGTIGGEYYITYRHGLRCLAEGVTDVIVDHSDGKREVYKLTVSGFVPTTAPTTMPPEITNTTTASTEPLVTTTTAGPDAPFIVVTYTYRALHTGESNEIKISDRKTGNPPETINIEYYGKRLKFDYNKETGILTVTALPGDRDGYADFTVTSDELYGSKDVSFYVYGGADPEAENVTLAFYNDTMINGLTVPVGCTREIQLYRNENGERVPANVVSVTFPKDRNGSDNPERNLSVAYEKDSNVITFDGLDCCPVVIEVMGEGCEYSVFLSVYCVFMDAYLPLEYDDTPMAVGETRVITLKPVDSIPLGNVRILSDRSVPEDCVTIEYEEGSTEVYVTAVREGKAHISIYSNEYTFGGGASFDIVSEKIVQPTLIGDADMNGEVGVADVVTVGKYIASADSFPIASAEARANADVNRDGAVDTLDLSVLIEAMMGKVTLD